MVEVRSQEERSLLLAGYVLGELSAEEGHLLAQILAAEPALHEELAELQASCDQMYGATSE
ncbi:MAG: anti-sigma factor, partial [Cyanobacteria bacterium P01_F01_bin.3]